MKLAEDWNKKKKNLVTGHYFKRSIEEAALKKKSYETRWITE